MYCSANRCKRRSAKAINPHPRSPAEHRGEAGVRPAEPRLAVLRGAAPCLGRPSEIQTWVRSRADVLAPATVEVIYRYLAAIFAAAVEDRLIPASPCSRKVKLPRREEGHVVPLAVKAVAALVDAIPLRYRAVVVLAAGTGLRQGECFGSPSTGSTSCVGR